MEYYQVELEEKKKNENISLLELLLTKNMGFVGYANLILQLVPY